MSGRKIEVLVALVVAGVTLAVAAPAGAQAATSHPAMAQKAAAAQGTVKVKEATPGLAAQATISADSAQKVALAQVSHGWVREAELEQEKGTLVYSYDIKERGKAGVTEVLIDAKTGALVSKTHETAKAEAKEAANDKAAAKTAKPKAKPMAKSTVAPKPMTTAPAPTAAPATTKP